MFHGSLPAVIRSLPTKSKTTRVGSLVVIMASEHSSRLSFLFFFGFWLVFGFELLLTVIAAGGVQ